VRDAYRLRAKRLHPDTSRHRDAASLMVLVNDAFRILNDAATRAEYDRIYRLVELPPPPG
jgi:curved DNA-binding protein CbpA